MALTPQQATALKADIIADAVLNALPNTLDNAHTIALAYNTASNPATNVWRSSISATEITGAITMSAFVSRTALQQNGLLLLTQGPVDATQANVRAAFNDIFGAGATLTALTALAQRVGTRFEILFSAVAGAARVSSVLGQAVNEQDVMKARNS